MTLPTPITDHLQEKEYRDVYEPAEDTFLLLDALESQKEYFVQLQPRVVVEIGCGSGCVIAFLSLLLGKDVEYIATDINPQAIAAARVTLEINQCPPVTLIQDDLLGKERNDVDVLVFNPPYVPTDEEEIVREGHQGAMIGGAWAGGVDGREIVDRVLFKLKDWLSPKGVAYIVALEDNDIESMAGVVAKDEFCTKIVLRRKAGRERLVVLKIER